MVKRFDRTTAQQRAIEKALARMMSRRAAKAKKGHEKAMASRKRREREKREAKAGGKYPNIFKRGSNGTRQKLVLPAAQVICARMEPGAWHRFGEIRALVPEYAKGTIKLQVMVHLIEKGWLERAENPDFDASVPEKAMASGRYLYRVPAAVADLAAEWRSELGEG